MDGKVPAPQFEPTSCIASSTACLERLLHHRDHRPLSFTPLRYRGMACEPEVSDKEVLTRALRSSAASVPEPVVGES